MAQSGQRSCIQLRWDPGCGALRLASLWEWKPEERLKHATARAKQQQWCASQNLCHSGTVQSALMHTAKMGSWLLCAQTGSIVGLETKSRDWNVWLHAQNSSNEPPVKTCATMAQSSQRWNIQLRQDPGCGALRQAAITTSQNLPQTGLRTRRAVAVTGEGPSHSSWTLTSHQPHWVASGPSHSCSSWMPVS